MLGPMGAHIISSLRIMTPSEIDRYMANGQQGMSQVEAIAAGAEHLTTHDDPLPQNYKQQDTGQSAKEAKVIPINPARHGERQASNLEDIGIFSSEKQREQELTSQKQKLSKQASSTVFLLSERNKLKSTKRRMEHASALKSYNETMHIDTHAKSKSDDGHRNESEKVVGVRGILLDKKQ